MKDLLDLFKDVKKTRGSVFGAFRRNFEMDLDKISSESGISVEDILKIEKDEIKITREQAIKLGKAMGVNGERFFDEYLEE
jgi:plasmid maintenance system antidote protein VapI